MGTPESNDFAAADDLSSPGGGYHLGENDGTAARDTAERYLRDTVLFASVLFLVAIAQRFKVRSGTGAFHDTVTSRPLLELALAPD